ncbi:hypothetical protein TNIN_283251 [Trichonephila inaurata madagascariensis]|uniref:Uncharacterized protein n=1 Tax=Trichonephila inaurata madagascariensis TaxID=2747483 RepID=A0A8X6XRL7_9ARAC|nr:hypothetical protein TNIN_283251 [Trichonephila inaurata madagascariensis]
MGMRGFSCTFVELSVRGKKKKKENTISQPRVEVINRLFPVFPGQETVPGRFRFQEWAQVLHRSISSEKGERRPLVTKVGSSDENKGGREQGRGANFQCRLFNRTKDWIQNEKVVSDAFLFLFVKDFR